MAPDDFSNSDHLKKMYDFVNAEDFKSLEEYVAQLIGTAYESPQTLDEWMKDPRREAIRVALSFLHTNSDFSPYAQEITDLKLGDLTEDTFFQDIGSFLQKTEHFFEFIGLVETTHGIWAYIHLFNEIAQYHALDIEEPPTMTEAYEMFLGEAPTYFDSFDDLLNQMQLQPQDTEIHIDIPDVERAWKEMSEQETYFSEDFSEEWQ
jgi:hypothetical protein